MDRIENSFDSLEQSVRRLSAAVDLLDRAADRRTLQDEARATVEEEYALMQDDRSRLAVELDAALDRSRALESANVEAAGRLAQAARAIRGFLERAGESAGQDAGPA